MTNHKCTECSHGCSLEGKDMIIPAYCPMDGRVTEWIKED